MKILTDRIEKDQISVLDREPAAGALNHYGLLDKLIAYESDNNWKMVVYADDPHHWVAGMEFSKFENESDNGFLVFCMPKSIYSASQFEDKIQEFVGEGCEGTVTAESIPLTQTNHN